MSWAGRAAAFAAVLRVPVYSAPKQRRIGAGTFFTCFIIGYGLLYAGNLTGQGVVWLIDSLLGIPYDNYVSGMIMDTNLWQALLVYVLMLRRRRSLCSVSC